VTGAASTAPPAELLPHWARWAPLAVFVVFIAIDLTRATVGWPVAATAAAGAIAAAALVGSRRPPMLLWAAVAMAGIAVIASGLSSNQGWFAICLLGAWCSLAGTRLDAIGTWAGAMIIFAVQWLWFQADPGWGAWMAGTTLSVLAGLLIRHELDLVARLRVAQAGLAERARTEERNRIAHELHDVIAHTLTVSLLHVTSARLAVEFDPADAARSLQEAERLGRESLAEVRTAVGQLHADEGTGTARTAPLPDLSGLPALIDRFRAARADVTLTVDGPVDGLPATTGLAVYRIVQEALTNAIKHAPGAAIAVDVTVEAARDIGEPGPAVTVRVDSSGPPREGSGLGMISMRERAESVGGRCVAGPGGHGWLVQARLPIEPTARRVAGP
jgi:signal transduction histidine kinase